MKKYLFLFFIIGTFRFHTAGQIIEKTTASTKTWYTNPLNVQFGDPYVLYTQGMYYMYGTGGGAIKGFAAYSSKDLVN